MDILVHPKVDTRGVGENRFNNHKFKRKRIRAFEQRGFLCQSLKLMSA